MLETNATTIFDYSLVCHAEVDLPAWLGSLSGRSGWKLWREENDENCDIYLFHNAAIEAQVILYHTGYAMVEVGGVVLYDDHLTSAHGYASLHYFNADSGQQVLLN